MTSIDDEPMSKGDFARLIGVTNSTLRKYIRDGKITGDSIVGTGREAKIKPATAIRQLRESLDPVRARANLDDAPRVGGVRIAQPSKTTTALRREQLRGLRLRNRRALREQPAGEYARAADVRPAMRRLIEQTAAIFDDNDATGIADRFCRQFGLPPEQARPWLVEEFRRAREDVRRRALALLGGPHANGGRPPDE